MRAPSDADRRAAVRLCLLVLAVPLAVGVGAAVGKAACALDATWGAVALLAAAAVGASPPASSPTPPPSTISSAGP